MSAETQGNNPVNPDITKTAKDESAASYNALREQLGLPITNRIPPAEKVRAAEAWSAVIHGMTELSTPEHDTPPLHLSNEHFISRYLPAQLLLSIG